MSSILIATLGIIGLITFGFYLMFKQGKAMDKTPNGFGEFGLEATNPVPFKDIAGSLAYLDILKTAEGQKIDYKRLSSVRVDNLKNPIDKYEISIQNEVIAIIYISPYQAHNSRTAPKGFKI